MQQAYLRKKKSQNAPKLKNYFEDDSDDDMPYRPPTTAAPPPPSKDDDYDPLDAFMAQNDVQIERDNSVVKPVESLPEIVSEQDVDYESNLATEVQ
jgi:hypothetical protein